MIRKQKNGFFDILAHYFNQWQKQPVVLVVHVAGATTEFANTVRSKLGPDSDLSNFGMDNVLVACIFSEDLITVSRKALMNMAIDASPSRFVMAGYELERGVVPSINTIFLAHRTLQIHKDSPGALHIVPQFGLTFGDHNYNLTIEALEDSQQHGRIKSVSKVEESECGEGDKASDFEEYRLFELIEEAWWKYSKYLPTDKGIPMKEITIEDQSFDLDRIRLKLSRLLSENEHYNLYSEDPSPIVLFDNIGPKYGILTTEIVREIDEFGGKLCHNNIRLAQMAALGFSIHVLAGVYAISTPSLRNSIGDPNSGPLGMSRCDGCFFFTKEKSHEEMLENISYDERSRHAKIALLWYELLSHKKW